MWSSIEGGLLYKLESLFKSFTGKISNLCHYDYWTHLKKLKMFSITRRYERYRIIYCFKVMKNLTPNCGLSWKSSHKYGRLFNLKEYGIYENINRKQSFHFMGPRLFNSLPSYLRTFEDNISFDSWKSALDKFLDSIPDNPVTGPNQSGLCEHLTTKQTNSLLYWIPFMGLTGRRANINVTYL